MANASGSDTTKLAITFLLGGVILGGAALLLFCKDGDDGKPAPSLKRVRFFNSSSQKAQRVEVKNKNGGGSIHSFTNVPKQGGFAKKDDLSVADVRDAIILITMDGDKLVDPIPTQAIGSAERLHELLIWLYDGDAADTYKVWVEQRFEDGDDDLPDLKDGEHDRTAKKK